MISVIMSTYREDIEYIKQSINSILTQTYRDFELIIVPDDPENQMIMKLLHEYEMHDPRIRIIENYKNLGLPCAMNLALGFAKGEYIARMDADDICFPERFELQMKYMEEHELDLVGGRKQCIDLQGNLIPKSESIYLEPDVVMQRMRTYDCLPHSTWLVKVEVYNRLNAYRNIPRCEDYDFLLRALKQGVKMGMCNQIILCHRINPEGISRSGMLEQELSSRYLIDNFERIESVTLEEIRGYISSEITPERQERYDKASEYYDKANQLRHSNLIKCAICVAKSMIISHDYRKRAVGALRREIILNVRKGICKK